jgi:hypothetical protein
VRFSYATQIETWTVRIHDATATGLAVTPAPGRFSEINQAIAEALRTKEKVHWARVALGGMARWTTSASVALAERPFSSVLG